MVPFVRAPLRVHRQRRLRECGHLTWPGWGCCLTTSGPTHSTTLIFVCKTNVEQQAGRWNCTNIYLRPGCLRPRRPALVHRPHHRFLGQPRPPARHDPIHQSGPRNLRDDIGTHRITITPEGQHVTLTQPVPQPTPGRDRTGCTPAV
jgi:hypothetical protein